MRKILVLQFFVIVVFHCCTVNKSQNELQEKPLVSKPETRKIWTKEQANTWYAKQGWLVGANFNPSTSINQLEMWQEESFDTSTINRELKWAASIGMNTARVYLHDLVHLQDSSGFYNRINTFLSIADRHKIKPLFVFFDSCWDPFPKAGKQRDPKPGLHNSGWVQSPGNLGLADTTQYLRLELYVKGVVRKFSQDERVLGWDIWNEPDNDTGPSYKAVDLPNKVSYVLPLLEKSFHWARSVNPSQPITSAVWLGDWSTHEGLKPIEKLQLEQSDIITFHNYDNREELEKRILWLQRYGRPIICTEYMARPQGSTFQTCLPVGKKYNVGMINWGLVDGKSQTKYPWNSWDKPYKKEPKIWFHEVFRTDGQPYDKEETDLIKKLTGTQRG